MSTTTSKSPKRKLKPIEICPDGHYYNSSKYGEICPVCGKQLDPPEPDKLTPEEIAELTYIEQKRWVCGWIVCTVGPNKGRAYEIHEGKNFVGSASSMDIQVVGDKRIEKSSHAIIVYDAKNRSTMLLPGESHGMVYLQEDAIFEPKILEPLNKISIGESEFIFAPLCCLEFDWGDI